NEDTYTPFPYFYDVTGWSNPLLFNLRGGNSGAVLDPAATRVRPVRDPGGPRPPGRPPEIALYQLDEGSSAIESSGWLRYLLDRGWRGAPPPPPPAPGRARGCGGPQTAPPPPPPSPWGRPPARP